MASQFTSVLEKSDNKLWGCHFRVPASVARKFIEGKSRRVVCTLNSSVEKQCALLPNGRGTFVITINKQLQRRLGLSVGMQVHVALKKDRSDYGLPVPAELTELFRQDKEGNRLFHALTPGRRRTLLYLVNQGKGVDDRIARAVIIIRHLKENSGTINYKKLSVQLRTKEAS